MFRLSLTSLGACKPRKLYMKSVSRYPVTMQMFIFTAKRIVRWARISRGLAESGSRCIQKTMIPSLTQPAQLAYTPESPSLPTWPAQLIKKPRKVLRGGVGVAADRGRGQHSP